MSRTKALEVKISYYGDYNVQCAKLDENGKAIKYFTIKARKVVFASGGKPSVPKSISTLGINPEDANFFLADNVMK